MQMSNCHSPSEADGWAECAALPPTNTPPTHTGGGNRCSTSLGLFSVHVSNTGKMNHWWTFPDVTAGNQILNPCRLFLLRKISAAATGGKTLPSSSSVVRVTAGTNVGQHVWRDSLLAVNGGAAASCLQVYSFSAQARADIYCDWIHEPSAAHWASDRSRRRREDQQNLSKMTSIIIFL